MSTPRLIPPSLAPAFNQYVQTVAPMLTLDERKVATGRDIWHAFNMATLNDGLGYLKSLPQIRRAAA